MSERWPQFDIKKDMATVEAGGFWCSGCLSGKPASEQSADPRYCQGCYDLLKKEVELLSPKAGKPSWTPREGSKTTADVSLQGTQIMSTVNGKNIEVDIIPPGTATRPSSKRGPRFTDLPMALINELAGKGLGSKAITGELAKQGYTVSYKTIQRRLQGVTVN